MHRPIASLTSTLSLALLLGCPEKSDETASGATTETASDSSGSSTGAPTTGPTTGATTGGPASCEEATSPAECAAAPSPAEVDSPCLWVPIYDFEETAGACTFVPATGKCLAPSPGDTDCNSYTADCGFNAFYGMSGDGKLQIARVEDLCLYGFTAGLELAFCQQEQDPDALPGLACACACSPDYPG